MDSISPFGIAPSSPAPDPPKKSRKTLRYVALGGVVVLLMGVSVIAGAFVFSGGDESDIDEQVSVDTTGGETTQPAVSAPSGSTTADGKVEVRDVTFQEGLIQRQFILVQPADLEPGEEVPLVVVIHGFAVDRFVMKAAADWEEAVAEDRFIAVFPQGSLGSWNAGACCPPATLVKAGDVGFIDRVIADVESQEHVDEDRIYVTGFSNGAMMSYFYACTRPDVVAAILPMAGMNVGGCESEAAIPTRNLHGDPDPSVPYDGSLGAASIIAGRAFPSVPDSVADWAESQGCDPDPDVSTVGQGPTEVETTTYSGCDDGSTVEAIRYPGNGHGWPTGPVDGLTEIREFFELS